MVSQALPGKVEKMPALFDDFFKPWNEWFDNSGFWGRTFNVPAVNIVELQGSYLVSLAAPGLSKDDFKIDVDGNIITIRCEKQESKEEIEKKFTRREYNFSSFSRSFSIPEEVNLEKIDARYEEGVLKIALPRRENAKKFTAKHIAVK